MTKALSDISGRLEGDLLALQGVMAKLAAEPVPSNPTFDQAPPPPPPTTKMKKEDYDHAKKLLEEIKGLAQSASDEIDRELKVPSPASASPPPEAEASPASTGSHSSKK